MEQSKIGIALRAIEDLVAEGKLPSDYRTTNFCFRQNPNNHKDKGYIWLDGRSSEHFFHWEGAKDGVLTCFVYEKTDKTASIWDNNENRIKQISVLEWDYDGALNICLVR